MRTAIVSSCLAILVFAGCTSKRVPTPNPPDFKVLKFSELPADVQEVLITTARNRDSGKSGHFADPDQKWNSTDVINEGNLSLPRRRLIFGGMVDGNWFVYYEHGGLGKHEHLVALSSSPGAPAYIFANMYASDRWTELREIRNALENGSSKSSDPGRCFRTPTRYDCGMAELLELLFYFVFELGGNALIELILEFLFNRLPAAIRRVLGLDNHPVVQAIVCAWWEWVQAD